MAKNALTFSSGHPDPRVLHTLAFIRRVFLVVVVLTSTVILFAWTVPSVGKLMPPSWTLMKANTAFCVLLSAVALQLCGGTLAPRAHRISRVCAVVVALIPLLTVYEYLRSTSIVIDTLLAADPTEMHGRMAPQTAIGLLLMATVTFFIRSRKSVLSRLVDGLTLCLIVFMVVLASGYFFGALHFFGPTMGNRVAPQTLFCLFLLTIVAFNIRTQFGVFAILTSDSIAGKTSRFAAPFALGLPFLLELLRSAAVKSKLLHYEYASATATTFIALLAFGSIFIMAHRIQALERNIRDLSLRDELTGLYNRRGFYVLATQALRLAQRSDLPFSVLFLDMDGLKHVNDTLGHEIGSELLKDMGAILITNFREIDIVGRLGGDEFVVAANSTPAELSIAIQRLQVATASSNSLASRAFSIEFSYGFVASDQTRGQTLDELLGNADRIMYEAKREKRRSTESNPVLQITA